MREGGAAPAASVISFPSFLLLTESLLLPCTGTTIPSIFFFTSCEGFAAAYSEQVRQRKSTYPGRGEGWGRGRGREEGTKMETTRDQSIAPAHAPDRLMLGQHTGGERGRGGGGGGGEAAVRGQEMEVAVTVTRGRC